jgi:hypothetical protein
LAKFAEIYLGIPVCTLPGIELEIKSKDKKASWVEYPTEADGGNHSKTRTSSRIPRDVLIHSYNNQRKYNDQSLISG